jgi:hypothetical protein
VGFIPRGLRSRCDHVTVRDLPTFREAYHRRRCIVPVDGFFEWKAIKGQRVKQPYAIVMNDGSKALTPMRPNLSKRAPVIAGASLDEFVRSPQLDFARLRHAHIKERKAAKRVGAKRQ